ncbi:right-handed parallel beta-helix repeat-containing protein [Cohnella hashimotonis]|uniref:Right-handed parallel beta-helix repeat-containing protein n=1 Tax=Cohnella hashimotonis TaxID=2826895 RepID=A0ABT6TP30_9BACL|nr:right-handed parallel beta-helix repeat-containing protein [Cohnella hashimotonis]MDI4648617.1 right-handed parallel beta-helix repeat-containing protein [Cohnella hashimotonis]
MKKIGLTAMALALGLGLSNSIVSVKDAQAVSVSSLYAAPQDFSVTQGRNQWFYQKSAGSVYSNLAYNADDTRWQAAADSGYPWVSKDAMHPSKDFDAVRKWVSPGKGTVTIGGTVKKGDDKGDGILATIKKDKTTLWSAVVSTTDGNSPEVKPVAVEKGTAIYFEVNSRASMNNDHTLWDPEITFTAVNASSTVKAAATSNAVKPAATQVAKPAASSVAKPTVAVAANANSYALSVTSCGAVANDGKDDYGAFAACLDKAKAQGKYVSVPAGEYQLSKILTLNGVKLIGAGMTKTTLISTDPQNGSIDLKGNNAKLSGVKHVYQTTVARGDGSNEKNSITVRGATNFTIDGVYVYKSSTAGILVQGAAKGGTITNNTVDSTGADGIHITDGSSDILIEKNTVKATGDDTIAVVSYAQDGPAVHDVTIRGNDVGYLSKARGIAVVGGTDVLIEDNSVKDTHMAGIYIAVEANYNTVNVDRITVKNNTIDHAGIHEPENHPNVLIYASQGVIDNVTFAGNTIKNAAHRGIGVWGDGQIKDIYFTKNTLINAVGANTTFKAGTIHLSNNTGF